MFDREDSERIRDVLKRLVSVSDQLEDRPLAFLPAGDSGLATVIHAEDRTSLLLTHEGVPVVDPKVAEFICHAYEDLSWAVTLLSNARGAFQTIRHLVREED